MYQSGGLNPFWNQKQGKGAGVLLGKRQRRTKKQIVKPLPHKRSRGNTQLQIKQKRTPEELPKTSKAYRESL
jgi:hypothetical protein